MLAASRLLAVIVLGVVASGCGASRHRASAESTTAGLATSTETVAVPPGRPNPQRFLHWSRAERSVELTLAAGLDSSNNGYNFDGYGRGELLVTVPVGWRVTIECVNRSSRRASCAVSPSTQHGGPAIPGATIAHAVTGLAPGARASFAFTPRRTGSYRLVSLVPGQAAARMFDVLDVVRGGVPSASARAGP
jgi:sulfocyanin SoxE-like protein